MALRCSRRYGAVDQFTKKAGLRQSVASRLKDDKSETIKTEKRKKDAKDEPKDVSKKNNNRRPSKLDRSTGRGTKPEKAPKKTDDRLARKEDEKAPAKGSKADKSKAPVLAKK